MDANIVVAAFLRDSMVRRILSLSLVEFLAPEFLFEELSPHLPELVRRAGLSESKAQELLRSLREVIGTVPEDSVRSTWSRAAAVMAPIDPRDIAYVAAALAVPCDGVWSDDPHLKRQTAVPCWTTKDLLDALRRDGLEV